jgi:uncharacterized protein YaiI (UPF0178 family)
MPHNCVDAYSCPEKDEVYKVAKRYDLVVTLVPEQSRPTPCFGFTRDP